MVGRVGALISMHQMNLSSYVVQERCIEIGSHLHRYCRHQGRLRRLVVRLVVPVALWQMHRDQVSPASLLPASGAASPPCRPGTGLPVRYGRCIEIAPHLHRDCRHQGRLRRLVVPYWFANALWQMHRDRVSPCIAIAGIRGGFAALSSGTGSPVRYGRCIEIAPHLHRHCRHQGRLRRLVVPVLVCQCAMADA